jgi:hypothetical protein
MFDPDTMEPRVRREISHVSRNIHPQNTTLMASPSNTNRQKKYIGNGMTFEVKMSEIILKAWLSTAKSEIFKLL